MAVFTVHQPPLGKGETAPDSTRFAFVRDGFYFWGFIFSVLWMLRHRLWLVAVLFVALTVLIEVGLRYAGFGSGSRSVVMIALCFLVGLEGATLRRWTLARRGYTPVGVVIADNQDEAEHRFFMGWTGPRKAKPVAAPQVPVESSYRHRNAAPDVLGSFPQPEPPR